MIQKVVMMPGTRGQDFMVCSCHYHLVKDHKWYVMRSGHVARSIWDVGKGKNLATIYIHRVIAGAPDGVGVDHRDTNPLNNTCWNLRPGNQNLNVANSNISRRNTSGYKGVAWHKQAKKWRAYISLESRQRALGLFFTPEEAALAYNRAALAQWGEYALLNVVNWKQSQASKEE